MKTASISKGMARLTLLAACLLLAGGCKKSETAGADQPKSQEPSSSPGTPARASAEKTSFQEVTSQLDPGGNFYVYLSTEQLLEGVSAKVSSLRQILSAIPDVKPEDLENISKGFDVLTHLIRDSGIEEVSGVGMSAIAREKDFYRTKTLVHHYPGKGSGFVWKLFGQKAHKLEGLSLLPTNTALAAFSDLDIPLAWSVIQKQVAESRFPQAGELLEKLPAGFEKATGLKWEAVLGSLGGEFGLVMTLDGEKKVSIPLPGSEPLEVPEPGLMLMAKVKNDTLFNRIDEALKQTGAPVVRVDKPNLKMRTMPVPLPLPIELRPTVASSEGYLFLATTEGLIQEALAVKAGQKPGLKSTAEFQRIAQGIPQEGNSFTFLSPRFGQALVQIQGQALEMTSKAPAGQKAWLKSFMQPGNAGFSYSVAANTDSGWLTVGNGNQHPANVLIASAVILPIGLSAIAVPNFVKARQTAQKAACVNNLRQLETAKQMWVLEKKKADTDTPTREELISYLGNQRFPTCPKGGDYTINDIAHPAECSVAGHRLEN